MVNLYIYCDLSYMYIHMQALLILFVTILYSILSFSRILSQDTLALLQKCSLFTVIIRQKYNYQLFPITTRRYVIST